MNRREFLISALAAGCAPCASSAVPQLNAQPFALRDVQLLESEWTALMQKNREYLHSLDSDRLLHTFRLTAGLASSAESLQGWENPKVELRGHFMGHYLSGCAQMSVSARDEEIKVKANSIVAELAKCQND